MLHEGKRVVLFAPKATKEGVWEPHLCEWLPHIGGVGGNADFSNLAVFSHTDLGRKGDFPERFRRIAELADVVVIDEAHHFRNPGRRGDADEGADPSRYYRLYHLLDNAARPKTLFMLTATPINNRLSDFRHMAELFTRRDEAYFARTLGVNNLRAHFNNMEKALRQTVGHEVPDVSEVMIEGQDILANDEIFRQLVVQRSRAYARESQIRETGAAAVFPDRRPPQVPEYSIHKTYGRLLHLFEQAFTRAKPLFSLAIYSPYYNGMSSAGLAEKNREEIRVLISTDVLSEGLNLQDASRMINYDIHWNPVRLMQRIGRVDRRMNPDVEKRLVADHPQVASSRGKVSFWNFLPPEELNAILTLYTKVTEKTLLISKALGIEGKKLLTPEDDYEALKDFNHVSPPPLSPRPRPSPSTTSRPPWKRSHHEQPPDPPPLVPAPGSRCGRPTRNRSSTSSLTTKPMSPLTTLSLTTISPMTSLSSQPPIIHPPLAFVHHPTLSHRSGVTSVISSQSTSVNCR